VEIYSSALPALPNPVTLKDYPFSLELRYGGENSEIQLLSALACPKAQLLAKDWYSYKPEGEIHMSGHFAYLAISVPHPENPVLPVRIHFAVPYIRIEELDPLFLLDEAVSAGNFNKLEEIIQSIDPQEQLLRQRHHKDFDHLMELAQQLISDMVEACAFNTEERSVDIVAEPLTGDAKPRLDQIADAAGRAATSFKYQEAGFFASYRVWLPESRCWTEL
jgi:hypothetical protein